MVVEEDEEEICTKDPLTLLHGTCGLAGELEPGDFLFLPRVQSDGRRCGGTADLRYQAFGFLLTVNHGCPLPFVCPPSPNTFAFVALLFLFLLKKTNPFGKIFGLVCT